MDDVDILDEVDVMGADETGPGYYRYDKGLQAWDLWAAWGLDPYLANAVKYIVRAGRKSEDSASEAKDLRKAVHYMRKRMELRLVVAPRWSEAPEVSALDAFRAFGLSPGRVHALSLIRLSAECGHRLVVEQLEAACGALEAELAALGDGGRGEHPQTSLGVAQMAPHPDPLPQGGEGEKHPLASLEGGTGARRSDDGKPRRKGGRG